jgi:hypothetical protein
VRINPRQLIYIEFSKTSLVRELEMNIPKRKNSIASPVQTEARSGAQVHLV